MNKMQVSNSSISSLLSGLIFAISTMMILALVFSFLLFLSGMREAGLDTWIYIIHIIALLIGGFISGRKIGEKGWYHGAMLGVVYCLIIGLVGYLGFDTVLSMQSLVVLFMSIVSGALGGILGVNTKK